MKVSAAIDEEKLFFSSHPVYSSMPVDVIGTASLTSKLTRIMFIHIKQLLPEIAKEIRLRMVELEGRLKELGPELPADSKDQTHLLWNMV